MGLAETIADNLTELLEQLREHDPNFKFEVTVSQAGENDRHFFLHSAIEDDIDSRFVMLIVGPAGFKTTRTTSVPNAIAQQVARKLAAKLNAVENIYTSRKTVIATENKAKRKAAELKAKKILERSYKQ